ncbi:TRAP transporter large permease subunit, partial [Micrococcus sp. SIMBA_144]
MKDLPSIILKSMVSAASIMLLVGFANLFGWIMTREQIPQLIADSILGFSTNSVVVILLIILL